MFNSILVPVDLDHADHLTRAVKVAANLSKLSDAEVIFAGVHASAPSPTDERSVKYSAQLDEFTAAQAHAHQIKARSLPVLSRGAVFDVAAILVDVAKENAVDLVVVASHVPGWAEHIFHSNAGYVACHAPMSVMVVR